MLSGSWAFVPALLTFLQGIYGDFLLIYPNMTQALVRLNQPFILMETITDMLYSSTADSRKHSVWPSVSRDSDLRSSQNLLSDVDYFIALALPVCWTPWLVAFKHVCPSLVPFESNMSLHKTCWNFGIVCKLHGSMCVNGKSRYKLVRKRNKWQNVLKIRDTSW